MYEEGNKDPINIMTSSFKVRLTGFSQMTKSRNNMVFTWTDEREKRIKVARLALHWF